tara:strand:+ start:505 stop:735 length:231 start_codon:yes stop_codon:yes gene_type:complete
MPKRQRFNSGLQDSRRQFSREDILRMEQGETEFRTDLLPTMKERSDLISNENLKLGREMIQLMGSGKKSRRKKKVK